MAKDTTDYPGLTAGISAEQAKIAQQAANDALKAKLQADKAAWKAAYLAKKADEEAAKAQ